MYLIIDGDCCRFVGYDDLSDFLVIVVILLFERGNREHMSGKRHCAGLLLCGDEDAHQPWTFAANEKNFNLGM